MRTCRLGALAALVLVAGCDPESMGAGSATREKVTVAGRSVTIAAPPGLCIDQGSTRVDAAGAFVLMRDCADGAEARPPRTALTASVSSGGLTGEGDAAADTLADLQAFIETPDGLALVGRSGRSDRVRVLAQTVSSDVLFVGRGPRAAADRRARPQLLARLPRGQRPDDGAVGARLRRLRSAAGPRRARRARLGDPGGEPGLSGGVRRCRRCRR